MKENVTIGDIYQSGTAYSGFLTYEVSGETAQFWRLTVLEWSRDLVNEKGVMYRTAETIKVRKRPDGFMWKGGLGSLRKVYEPRTIRDRPSDV